MIIWIELKVEFERWLISSTRNPLTARSVVLTTCTTIRFYYILDLSNKDAIAPWADGTYGKEAKRKQEYNRETHVLKIYTIVLR